MLILFDIDGTLLLTDRAGSKSMQEAGKRVLGERWDLKRETFAGRLDSLIFEDGARRAGCPPHPDLHARFRSTYAEVLRRRLSDGHRAWTLPGVDALIAHLRGESWLTLGLVTGNYPETGRLKLDAAGLDPDDFLACAWGDDGAARRALPPVAMARYEALVGRPAEAARTVIVGDTIHDIECARANGCPVVAVGTGPVTWATGDLAAHAPDLLLEDLSDPEPFLAFLDERRG